MLVTPNTLSSAVVIHIPNLTDCDKTRMFQLYNTYYMGSQEAVFQADLLTKSHAILLHDTQGVMQGFSTLALYEEEYQESPLRIIYSGDTIIDKAYWGQPLFAKKWLQLAGELTTYSPDVPLYWLLIVKGHRTYRYLQLFSQNYYPHYSKQTPPMVQDLMDHLASQRFGEFYKQNRGLVYFPEPRSFLCSELAVIPKKDLKRPEVQFFMSKNPNYTQGDEMVCLCELSQKNLTRFSRKWFLEGIQQGVQQRHH